MANSSESCIFCNIIAGAVPSFRLYEDDHTVAFMDINPAGEGHSLVVPKEHASDLHAISEEAMARTAVVAKRVASAVAAAVEPDGINLIQSNGPAAGQSVFHLHVHVLPRRKGDGLSLNWELVPGDTDAIGALAEKIRGHL